MGTSTVFRPRRHSFWDHPHAYGDKFLDTLITATSSGSSPRVWGQVCHYGSGSFLFGIIPTRMGTRLFFTFLSVRRQDHPHAYGDKVRVAALFVIRLGSSPRVWGQGGFLLDWDSSLRIIPTRMGTSDFWRTAVLLGQDHPHAYGDKDKVFLPKITG